MSESDNPKEYFIYGQSKMKYSADPGDILSFGRQSEGPERQYRFIALCPLYPGDEVLLAWPNGRDPGEVIGVRRDGETVCPESMQEDVTQVGPPLVWPLDTI